MPNLIDLLSEQDKEKVLKWEKEKMSPKHETEIPPEIYIVAEAGHFWGWPAIEAIKRGYIESEDTAGKRVKVPITTAEIIALCKAERKLRYRELIDNGDMQVRANISSTSKKPSKTFEENIKGYKKAAQ